MSIVRRGLSLIALVAVSLFLVNPAFAVDYYWTTTTGGTQYPDPETACRNYVPAESDNYSYRHAYAQFSSPTQYWCYFIRTTKSTGQDGAPSYIISGTPRRAVRSGDSCPNGTNYNASTGLCEAPNRCEATIGQVVTHEHKMKEAVGQPLIEPPGSVCANSCQYAFGFTSASNVYVYSSGNPPGVFGVYSYTGNGIECNEDTRKEPGNPGQQTDPDETPTPDPDNQCPDGYVWNGTFCSKEPPPPCDPEVEVGGCDDTENPDPDEPGDGDEDGDGDGDGDGEGDGGGDGEGDGDGDGDGKCDPAKDPYKCEKPGVEGEACDAEVKCVGDAVQCAILRQQKELRCHAEEQADFEKHKPAIESAVQGDKFKLEEGAEIQLPSFINQGTRFLPATCPSAESFSLRTGGGRSFQISYEPLCRAASDLSGLFVAVATVLAALYVGRAVGGQ